jgi:general secretion pathway protein E
MSEYGVVDVWAARFVTLSAAALVVGAGATAWVGGDFGSTVHDVGVVWRRAVDGTWQTVGIAGGAVFALGIVLSGVARRLRPAGPARREFSTIAESGLRESLGEVRRRITECVAGDAPNVIAGLEELLRGAVQVSASDVHLSPNPSGLRLTYRVQGTLHEVLTLPSELSPLFTTRIKVLARLDTAQRGVPQDGRLVTAIGSGNVEARVSTLPTESGERVVMRLVRGSLRVPELESLGLSDALLVQLTELLSKPQGLILVTGPVGSGKTTSLYAALQHVARTRGDTTTCVTLEDPIEIELPFATQTQVNQKAGLTFAGTLRSVLRQDPNVLMVGEIRDRETADIAMQAGLTGHLLLTTVHGDSAAGAFARLADMEIEPFVLASATIGSLSQRLVRVLCTACRRPAEPELLQLERLHRHGVELPQGTYFEPAGCPHCEFQGFTGRVPIGELLVMSPTLRGAVNARKPTGDIRDAAMAEGMRPLIVDGLDRAASGETSLGEVLRVVG